VGEHGELIGEILTGGDAVFRIGVGFAFGVGAFEFFYALFGVDGQSVLPIIRDPQSEWRDYVHGECASVPTSNSGMQYLTNGKLKYVWLPGQDRELFFDIENDPCEMTNLADNSDWAEEIAKWRNHLVEELKGRPEGFTDGERLIKQDGSTRGTIPVWEDYTG